MQFKHFIKLTNSFYLLKHKTKKLFLAGCAHCTFPTCANADTHLKVYVFSEKKYQTPIKTSNPGDSASEKASAEFPQSSASTTPARLLAEMSTLRDYPAKTADKSTLSHNRL